VRKRLIIAAIAVVVIGIGAYVLSQPRKGTVEWHKKQYLNAMKWSWSHRLMVTWDRIRGKGRSPHRILDARALERRDEHRAALLRFGYLQERKFWLTNQSARQVAFSVSTKAAEKVLVDERRSFLTLMIYGPGETNLLTLIAVGEDVPIWEELIRKADVPETK
jgi:hypothetical protein